MLLKESFDLTKNIYSKIEENFKAEPDVLKKILCVWLAGGHLLLNDKPGTGKTTLAKILAGLVSAKFKRIQFTPDVTPSDVIGVNVLNTSTQHWDFHEGPIFSNIVLADEINRAPPRTQSALLEAMAENQVSVDGITTKLDDSFFVIATQNPLEFEGTYMLPEAQNDRFAMRLSLGEKSKKEEMDIIMGKYNFKGIEPVISIEKWKLLQSSLKTIEVHEDIALYVVNILRKTREHSMLLNGSSSRGGQALINCARAYALLEGNNKVIPDYIYKLAPSILSHRVSLTEDAYLDNKSEEDVINEILENINPGLTFDEKD